MALGLILGAGCTTEEPPKKASGAILKAWPDKPAENAVHPDLKIPDGPEVDSPAPDLKPLEPAVPADDPDALEDEAPSPAPHPDLKAFPAD